MVYDVTNRDSFVRIENWLAELDTYSTNPDIVKMLVGNKVIIYCNYYVKYHERSYICFNDDILNKTFYILFMKCDMEAQGARVVSKEEGLNCARKHQMMFIEASAKTREGVQCAFEELVEKIIQTPQLWENTQPKNKSGNTINVDQPSDYSSGCSYCTVL